MAGQSSRNDSPALVCWFSGLSGAGKSTISVAAEQRLQARGLRVLTLDGDEIREQIHTSLGFARDDIRENNRLVAEICLSRRGLYDVILVPIISPLAESRMAARIALQPDFMLVACATDVSVAATRDVKGLYSKADRGEITDLIGYSPGGVAYEPPTDAEIVLDTGHGDVDILADELCSRILQALHVGQSEAI